ncbi:helix-turn-helix domain-containing protein [Lachnospira eligens]|uniref:helix-turn-helix domain-containing protein n=1 Tax=Lachnospira eligens TaxID=39485 RepID=UPI000E50F04D|nr:helix-turn-helix transcriptional regulator [Lachnospira eligens]RHI68899.1 LuxR family transcriptional regulator [Lachnospira eligens]
MNSPQKETIKAGSTKTITSLPHIYAIILMGLFTFVFLSVEYMFVSRISLLVSQQRATLSQNYVLGVSTAGFLLYPLFKHFLNNRLYKLLMIITGLLSVFLTISTSYGKSFEYIFSGGIILFILLGLVGSNAYYVSACMVRNRHLAKTAGISYFLGILLQFINHNAIHIRTIQLVILSVSMLLLFILLIENERILSRYSTDKYAAKTIIESSAKGNKHNLLLYISIIVLVILMACLFSTLDSAVTLIHSDGIADIGQGARILLAFSGLAAGFIFDISNRKYTGIIMYCIMILSTLCIVLLEFSKPFVAVLIVFYLSAGFFAVFFTSEFMELSQYARIPELWAGMGRAVNNVTAAVIASFVLQLLSSDNNLLKIILILVLFVLVSIMSVIYTFEKYYFIQQFTQHTDEVTNEQDQLHKLTTQYSFTEREGEVFSYLVTTEDNIQTISEHMHVSRRTLERHISAIYEKTGVKSRVGLINLFNKCV